MTAWSDFFSPRPHVAERLVPRPHFGGADAEPPALLEVLQEDGIDLAGIHVPREAGLVGAVDDQGSRRRRSDVRTIVREPRAPRRAGPSTPSEPRTQKGPPSQSVPPPAPAVPAAGPQVGWARRGSSPPRPTPSARVPRIDATQRKNERRREQREASHLLASPEGRKRRAGERLLEGRGVGSPTRPANPRGGHANQRVVIAPR